MKGVHRVVRTTSLIALATWSLSAASKPPERYIIRYAPGADSAVLSAVESQRGRLHRRIANRRLLSVSLPEPALKGLRARSDVELLEVDPKRFTQAQETPYGIGMVGATSLSLPSGHGRKICIMDTGYDRTHEDLPQSSALVSGNDGYAGGCASADCDTGNWYEDGHGHGTHVSGTIAALGNNNLGVVGVNPNNDLPIHMVKVFNDAGTWAYGSDLIAAIQQCRDAGAQIISMSLGGSGSSSAERDAFDAAAAAGVLSIAAAGNSGGSNLSYPASYDSVMSVAAIDSAEQVATFSQYNHQVEIAAPGVGVLSTLPGNQYAYWNGTSMATPHVSGVAALVWGRASGRNQDCTPEQIRNALNVGASAHEIGGPGWDSAYGHGLVSAVATDALLAANADCNVGSPTGIVTSPLTNGVPTSASGVRADEVAFQLAGVPAGASDLRFTTSGGSGDADLYVRFGARPTGDLWDCRPYINGNSETCVEDAPSAGTWYAMLRGYASFDNVNLTATYTDPSGGGGGGAGPSYFYPAEDIPVIGNVTGSYLNLDENSTYQLITEVESNGKRNERTSIAVHEWRIPNVAAGESVTLHIVAGLDDRGDNESFAFDISYNGGSWQNDILTVSPGPYDTYDVALPSTTSGTVLVRTRDTDRTPRNLGMERLWMDQLYIVSSGEAVDPPAPPPPDDPPVDPGLSLTANGSKVQGRIVVSLQWTPPTTDVVITRQVNGGPAVELDGPVDCTGVGCSYTDATGLKGAPVLTYEVCEGTDCDNATVTF